MAMQAREKAARPRTMSGFRPRLSARIPQKGEEMAERQLRDVTR